ncbi:MAG TPA: Hsp20/alpha crystallin family protein [Desulfurivibrio alkaliphilus]|uniref:Hsp20/alpha crystallin family protein n=1 Tax=Desulfurivibrio alkaliphilus TaxID=427923 RepID=A0A7C2TLA9_9BACT|nr:Hsp20/alpha crystallin family protein [Desulfurivibrio alkaliphilus]
MAIMRFYDQPVFRNPWADLEKMRREFDALFRGGGGDFPARPGATVFPALNVAEDEHAIHVRAEIPGVKAAELDIAVEGDTLTIKGERRLETGVEKCSYHRREIERGRFSRALTLPTRINPEGVKATTQNGILLITLPKAEEVKPRRIEVKSD